MMIELCLGSIYAYSILSLPLMDLFEQSGLKVSATAMQALYMALLVVTALTIPLVGQFIEVRAQMGVHGRWGAHRPGLALASLPH